ncbi:hypothetical protein GIB67_022029 [Kingdonia uniflora]|uniref:Uncharacterized protein n=1 Tax=Kingdonia uniflora TaxID=39325 RepID=A0A7J7MUE9_9MAGN|nr:hypothetical protein GIB67_022029 [Kingdonia uniflora]
MYQICNNEEEKENGVEVVKGMDGVINVTQALTVIDTPVRGRELLEGLKDHFTRAYDSGSSTIWADSSEDGRITREEVQELIILSASTNKLSKLKEQAQEYASLIMEELDPENLGYIETWMYIYVPLLLYICERSPRACRSTRYSVKNLKVSVLAGSVFSLVMSVIQQSPTVEVAAQAYRCLMLQG